MLYLGQQTYRSTCVYFSEAVAQIRVNPVGTGASGAQLPADPATQQLGEQPGWASWLPAPWHGRQVPPPRAPPPPLHPDCIHGRSRPQGMAAAARGQCWQELQQHQQRIQESAGGGISRFFHIAGVPLWDILQRPREWWRSKPPAPMPQDLEALRKLEAKARAQHPGSAATADSVPWTSFNDSAMAQIYSHDIAWMMEQEVRLPDPVMLPGGRGKQARLVHDRLM